MSQPLLNTEYEDLGIVEEELIYLKNDFEFHLILRVSCQAFWLQNGNIKPDIEKLVSAHQAHPSHGKPAQAK